VFATRFDERRWGEMIGAVEFDPTCPIERPLPADDADLRVASPTVAAMPALPSTPDTTLTETFDGAAAGWHQGVTTDEYGRQEYSVESGEYRITLDLDVGFRTYWTLLAVDPVREPYAVTASIDSASTGRCGLVVQAGADIVVVGIDRATGLGVVRNFGATGDGTLGQFPVAVAAGVTALSLVVDDQLGHVVVDGTEVARFRHPALRSIDHVGLAGADATTIACRFAELRVATG